jgi:hypothetical protein
MDNKSVSVVFVFAAMFAVIFGMTVGGTIGTTYDRDEHLASVAKACEMVHGTLEHEYLCVVNGKPAFVG